MAERFSPRVEDAGEGIAYLDVDGHRAPLPGPSPELELGRSLIAAAEAAGLPARVGIASSKLAARVAAGLPELAGGRARGRGGRLPGAAAARPPRPEVEIAATLERWGVRSIGDFARLPRGAGGEPPGPDRPRAARHGARHRSPAADPARAAAGLPRGDEPGVAAGLAGALPVRRPRGARAALPAPGGARPRLHPPGAWRCAWSRTATRRARSTCRRPPATSRRCSPWCAWTWRPARPARRWPASPSSPSRTGRARRSSRSTARRRSRRTSWRPPWPASSPCSAPTGSARPRPVDGHRPERFALVEFAPPPPPEVRREPRAGPRPARRAGAAPAGRAWRC